MRLRLAGLLLVTTLLAAACGGSSGGGDDPDPVDDPSDFDVTVDGFLADALATTRSGPFTFKGTTNLEANIAADGTKATDIDIEGESTSGTFDGTNLRQEIDLDVDFRNLIALFSQDIASDEFFVEFVDTGDLVSIRAPFLSTIVDPAAAADTPPSDQPLAEIARITVGGTEFGTVDTSALQDGDTERAIAALTGGFGAVSIDQVLAALGDASPGRHIDTEAIRGNRSLGVASTIPLADLLDAMAIPQSFFEATISSDEQRTQLDDLLDEPQDVTIWVADRDTVVRIELALDFGAVFDALGVEGQSADNFGLTISQQLDLDDFDDESLDVTAPDDGFDITDAIIAIVERLRG